MLGLSTGKLPLVGAVLALLFGAFALPSAPAAAYWHQFHGGVSGWGPHEAGLWRAGYWHHGWYGGRLGWWWGVGGAAYWYPEPVYPYPPVVSEVYVAQPSAAPVVVAPAAPVAPSYYYCDNPAGYYPAVPVCNQPFRAVPAAPQR